MTMNLSCVIRTFTSEERIYKYIFIILDTIAKYHNNWNSMIFYNNCVADQLRQLEGDKHWVAQNDMNKYGW